jgi:hypothetical protein
MYFIIIVNFIMQLFFGTSGRLKCWFQTDGRFFSSLSKGSAIALSKFAKGSSKFVTNVLRKIFKIPFERFPERTSLGLSNGSSKLQ